MKFPYNEKVLEHFKNPKNVGKLEDADGKAIEGSSACGDMVSLTLKVDPGTKVITDIKFESYGCASNIATGSIITEMAKGKTIDEAKKINWKEAATELGGLPKIKAHCSVLAVQGLRAAIQNYEEANGLVKDRKKTTINILKRRLKRVMNPMSGLDAVKTNLIKSLNIKDGRVAVEVALSPDHQFANSIKEEIIEKLEPLWDVNDVNVKFTEL